MGLSYRVRDCTVMSRRSSLWVELHLVFVDKKINAISVKIFITFLSVRGVLIGDYENWWIANSMRFATLLEVI